MHVFRVGIDIGSTTVKTVVLDQNGEMIHADYRWHYSDVRTSVLNLLKITMKNWAISSNFHDYRFWRH